MKIMLKSLRPGSEWAYKVAKEVSSKESKRHKQYYDCKFCIAWP